MKLLFAVLLFAPLITSSQPRSVYVRFNLNFEHLPTLQKFIDGVVYDGKRYVQIRQGTGGYNTLSGENSFTFTIAVQNGTKDFKFETGPVMIAPNDTVQLSYTIPDSLLPEFMSIAFTTAKGPFYAEDIYDTLNCVDASGNKQGLWLTYSRADGNCIDWLEYECRVYTENYLWIAINFKFDYNTCEKSNYILEVRNFKSTSPREALTTHRYEIDRGYGPNVAPGTNKGVDHNHFTPLEMKLMIREFISVKFSYMIPSFLSVKGLPGTYIWSNAKGKVKTGTWLTRGK